MVADRHHIGRGTTALCTREDDARRVRRRSSRRRPRGFDRWRRSRLPKPDTAAIRRARPVEVAERAPSAGTQCGTPARLRTSWDSALHRRSARQVSSVTSPQSQQTDQPLSRLSRSSWRRSAQIVPARHGPCISGWGSTSTHCAPTGTRTRSPTYVLGCRGSARISARSASEVLLHVRLTAFEEPRQPPPGRLGLRHPHGLVNHNAHTAGCRT